VGVILVLRGVFLLRDIKLVEIRLPLNILLNGESEIIKGAKNESVIEERTIH
jgi:hypothetical protein